MQRGKMNVVIGGQAGSEAKGKLSAYLVKKFNIDVVAGCLSPNAGHTAVVGGTKYVTHHIPAGAMAGIHYGKPMTIILGAASIINPHLLIKEMKELHIPNRTVFVDPRARIITPTMIKQEEDTMTSIGSTAQGVGACRRDKIMRSPDQYFANNPSIAKELGAVGISTVPVPNMLNNMLDHGRTVLYEMGQGFDLCLDHGIDPIYCTSRTINPATAFGEAGVALKHLGDVYGVIRPYPIRVNNRTGSSGPYAEAKEITWEEVGERSGAPGFAGEITTTTKLPRRVFEFCWSRFSKFLEVCDPTFLCLQFADYLNYYDRGNRSWIDLSNETKRFISQLNAAAGRSIVNYVGTGPNQEDMVDMGGDL